MTDPINTNTSIKAPIIDSDGQHHKPDEKKAIIDSSVLRDINSASEDGVNINIGSQNKFSVIVAAGDTTELTIPMKDPLSGKPLDDKKVITLVNHGTTPRLVSFRYDEEGIPCMRAGKTEKGQRKYASEVLDKSIRLNDAENSDYSKSLDPKSKDESDKKRVAKYDKYKGSTDFQNFNNAINDLKEKHKKRTKIEINGGSNSTTKLRTEPLKPQSARQAQPTDNQGDSPSVRRNKVSVKPGSSTGQDGGSGQAPPISPSTTPRRNVLQRGWDKLMGREEIPSTPKPIAPSENAGTAQETARETLQRLREVVAEKKDEAEKEDEAKKTD